MPEESQVDEIQEEEELFFPENCCDDCLDKDTCGNLLDELSEAVGEDLFDACACECEVAQDRWIERNAAHSNPDIDTSAAEPENPLDSEV